MIREISPNTYQFSSKTSSTIIAHKDQEEELKGIVQATNILYVNKIPISLTIIFWLRAGWEIIWFCGGLCFLALIAGGLIQYIIQLF